MRPPAPPLPHARANAQYSPARRYVMAEKRVNPMRHRSEAVDPKGDAPYVDAPGPAKAGRFGQRTMADPYETLGVKSDCERRGDPRRLPPARQAASPGPQSRQPARRGALQGNLRCPRPPVRCRQAGPLRSRGNRCERAGTAGTALLPRLRRRRRGNPLPFDLGPWRRRPGRYPLRVARPTPAKRRRPCAAGRRSPLHADGRFQRCGRRRQTHPRAAGRTEPGRQYPGRHRGRPGHAAQGTGVARVARRTRPATRSSKSASRRIHSSGARTTTS